MEEETNKIIFIIKKLKEGAFSDDLKMYYSHVIGDSSTICKILINSHGVDWVEAVEKALKNKKDGKFEVDDFIVYVLPHSIANLHTCQYPFVVMKNDEIIDIDEYWYTPFRSLLSENYHCFPLERIDNLESTTSYSSLSYADYGFFVKCTQTDESPLIATKTVNITFGKE